MKFEELNLNEDLQKSLTQNGFIHLTPIQEKAIPFALAGRDLTGLAQTGTGKTLAFLIPIVNKIFAEKLTGHTALILAPTRELVLQIQEEATKLFKGTDKKVTSLIGGTEYKGQLQDIEAKAEIIVATPGRLIDHIKSGKLILDTIKFFVLDEADRMFDMGFIKDIRYLMKKCPNDKQTLLFSATMSYYVIRIASDFLNNAVEVAIEADKVVTDNIDQKIIHLGKDEKIPYLVNLILQDTEEGLGIIFTNMKIFVPDIVNALAKYGIPTTGISSHLDQKKRIRLLKDFKIGKYKYMVATDVASRGIDVDNIKVVYNFDLPGDTENYVHRIGRTARAGKKGRSVSFCSEIDYHELEKIEKLVGNSIDAMEVNEAWLTYPTGEFTEFILTEKHKPFPKNNFSKDRSGKPSFRNKNENSSKKDFVKKDFPKKEFVKKEFPKKDFVKKDFQPKDKRSEIDIAMDYLQKADSVLGKEPKPKKDKFPKKDSQRPMKQNFEKKSQDKKENQNYDKTKRNLFDINENGAKNNSDKKVSIWKKVKSLFGR